MSQTRRSNLSCIKNKNEQLSFGKNVSERTFGICLGPYRNKSYMLQSYFRCYKLNGTFEFQKKDHLVKNTPREPFSVKNTNFFPNAQTT